MKIIAALAVVSLTTGCASYTPVIDTRNASKGLLELDLKECQSYASQRIDGAHGAAAGAVAGAIFGAVVGGILCGADCAGKGAALMAVTTGVTGAGSSMETQRMIVNRCMAGRGYNVLD